MKMERPLLVVLCGIGVAVACSTTDGTLSGSVTVQQLSAGDANCPTGGVAISANGTTAYACNGAAGAQGPQGMQGLQGLTGGGLYTSRSALKCNTVTGTNGLGVGAACDNATDLPVSGGCQSDPNVPDAVPTLDGPGNPADTWMAGNLAAKPVWGCSWRRTAGVGELPLASATICCITNK